MRTIKSVILHHSGSSVDTTVESINSWHKERNFTKYLDENGIVKHIGYHYIILGSSEIYRARPVEMIGCHTKYYNRDSIGICVTGNFMKDNITQERHASLTTLLFCLFQTFGLKEVTAHRDYANTLCPGDSLYYIFKDAVLRANWHVKNTRINGIPLTK